MIDINPLALTTQTLLACSSCVPRSLPVLSDTVRDASVLYGS